MNHTRSRQTRIRRIATRTQQTLLPLVAVGGGLASLPATALELGDVTVQSRLGQPLRASIAYALAPNEELSANCVTLGMGAAPSGLPGIGRATLSIADGTILLTGKTPVREPMVAAMVNVDCPYTANLRREYLMFIDPAEPASSSQPQPETSSAAAASATRNTPRVRTARPAVDQSPIAVADRYRVQPGDTLSQIVQRIENRSTSLWPAVNAIFDANPDAFIDDDPNKLKAGSWLAIPASVASQGPAATAVEPVAQDAGTAELPSNLAAANNASTIAETTIADTTTDLSAAAVVADTAAVATPSDNPFVDTQATSNETVIIPDTSLEGPTTVSSSPNVATAVIDTEPQASNYSWSWLMWLAGTGVALIITLLLFGRLFRGRPEEAEAIEAVPQRRATDLDPTIAPDDGGIEVITHTDYTIEDDSPTAENLTLDADLVVGTGLDNGTEMEVAQDFGFGSPTELDLELPFEPEPTVPESDTGIFAADEDETSLMESADDIDDDEYDLSVVVDATKMPQPEEVTQRDLQAVEVEPIDDGTPTDAYTINSEADFEILEQDYEDELTATQALNAEIQRAAEELAHDTANTTYDDYDITSEVTAATPLASVTELDVTAQLPSGSDEDETGIHEAATIEIPLAENDETAEMEVDDDTVDTKAI